MILAEYDLLVGRVMEARDCLSAFDEHSDLLQSPIGEWGMLVPLKAWMDLEEGNLEAAAEKLALVVSNAPDLFRVDALRVQGLLDMKQGRWREATAVLEEASALTRAMPYPYAEVKTLWVYGRLEAARGDLSAARQRFMAAQAICDQLGERLYRAHIERDLEALG